MLWDAAAEAKITGFLETLRAAGLRFDYTVRRAPPALPSPAALTLAASSDAPIASAPAPPPPPPATASPAPATPPAEANPSPADPVTPPQIEVDFTGPDAALFIERGGEVLHAMESLAAGILRLEPEENDLLSFNALGFKQARDAATARTAQQGIDAVRATGQPFVYPPMNSRERRMLHLVLATSGLPTASSGDGPRRFVVVYPPGATPTPERFDPPPPPRRPGFSNGRGGQGFSNNRGGQGFDRRPTARFTPGPPQPSQPVAPRSAPRSAPRLDPNGNPLEQPSRPEAAAATTEDERLASLRRAFRKR